MHRIIPLILAISFLGACEYPQGPLWAAAGTYSLDSIDGLPLPFHEWSEASGYSLITSGELTLREDATFQLLTTRYLFIRQPQMETIRTDTVVGTFSRRADELLLTAAAGGAEVLQLAGTTVQRMARVTNRAAPVRWIYGS
jgi:hypothetical protein